MTYLLLRSLILAALASAAALIVAEHPAHAQSTGAAPDPAPKRPTPETTLKPYGFIRLDAIYDTAAFNNPQAAIFVQRAVGGVEPGGEFSMHPRLSRIGVDIASNTPAEGLKLTGKLEVDFQNGGRESRAIPRMRHAYAEASYGAFRLLFGQTWQTVSRLIPMANGDTLMWGAGNAGDRSPQVRLSYLLPVGRGGRLTLESAAQMIGTVNEAGQAGLNFGDLPAVEGRAALDLPVWTKEPLHYAVATHYGRQELTEKAVGRKVFQQFGAFAELNVPFIDELGVRGEVFRGRNLADVRGGILQGINPVRDLEIRSYGFWAELWANPALWLALALGVGKDDPNDRDLESGQPSRNGAWWAVVHVRPIKRLRVGAEYLYWTTGFKDEPSRSAHRTGMHVQWEF